MQNPREKVTPESYGLYQERLASQETYVSFSNTPADERADEKVIESENVPTDEQFFTAYEFDDYQTGDYEVVNFELNSPEALEGLDNGTSGVDASSSSSDDAYSWSSSTDPISYDSSSANIYDDISLDLDNSSTSLDTTSQYVHTITDDSSIVDNFLNQNLNLPSDDGKIVKISDFFLPKL